MSEPTREAQEGDYLYDKGSNHILYVMDDMYEDECVSDKYSITVCNVDRGTLEPDGDGLRFHVGGLTNYKIVTRDWLHVQFNPLYETSEWLKGDILMSKSSSRDTYIIDSIDEANNGLELIDFDEEVLSFHHLSIKKLSLVNVSLMTRLLGVKL